jgi:AcrR family transcriptional regulator
MKASASDPRSQRTREQLFNALAELVPVRQFASLSIQDVTGAAGLNRTTFYLHYSGLHELLEDYAFGLFEELRTDIFSRRTIPDLSDAAAFTPFVLCVFRHLEQHEAFYRTMLGRQGDPLFRSLFQELISELIFEPVVARIPGHVLDPALEMKLRFFSDGCTGVATWWLIRGKPISAEHAAAQIARDILPDYFKLQG